MNSIDQKHLLFHLKEKKTVNRTNEYLYALQTRFGLGKVVFESIFTETDFGTSFYEITGYIVPYLVRQLNEGERFTYKVDGVASFLDKDGVITCETLDEAIRELFFYYENK